MYRNTKVYVLIHEGWDIVKDFYIKKIAVCRESVSRAVLTGLADGTNKSLMDKCTIGLSHRV